MRKAAHLTFGMFVLIFLSAVACCAQYRVLPGKLDVDGLPTTSARICLGTTGTDHCYTPPREKYTFGLNPKEETIGTHDGPDLILFRATFSGGGSGDLTSLALLEEHSGDFVSLLPVVQLTNQSEFKLWNLPQFSSLPILATADFVWDLAAMKASNYAEETHFARHRYQIGVYVFDQRTQKYLERVHYMTPKKYPGLDDSDSIRVLDAEKRAILAKLQPGPG
jgi:hypothetical protein